MSARCSSRIFRGRDRSLLVALFLTVAGALHYADKLRAPRSNLARCHAAKRGESSAQVFVRNVAFGADVQSLRAAMEETFGPVSDVWLPSDEVANKNRGYGIVTFDESVSMRMALEARTLRFTGRNLQIIESRANDGRGGGTGRGSLFHKMRTSRNHTEIGVLLEQLGEFNSIKEANIAISAWGRVREWERALELLSEMRQRGLEPDVITYSAAISACEKGSQWKRALELLSEMRQHGLKPDVIAYSAAISACEKGSQWEPALELLSEMRRRGLEPNVITYNAAISACEKGSQWERAFELLSKMRELGLEPDVITYNAAISACEKGSQWEHALELLSEMQQRGVEPDVVTYNACIQALIAAGNIDEAFRLLQGIPAELAKDTEAYMMHRSLLVACQFAGDPDRAQMVKLLMELHGVSRGASAVASAVIGGRLSEFSNEMGDSLNDAAMMDLLTEVASKSPYEVQFDALPIGFLDSSTKGQQKRSLRNHAEKKALAEMLAHGCDSLEIGVNFHMCVDCHAFFKAASQTLGRRIEVREPSVLHRFNEGGCSCSDQWRWEARFVGGSHSQQRSSKSATTNG